MNFMYKSSSLKITKFINYLFYKKKITYDLKNLESNISFTSQNLTK